MTTLFTELNRRQARACASVETELIVDNFAGAGGASLGIEAATGRAVDIAINHSRRAVEIHSINHPNTRHLCEDVWDVDPMTVVRENGFRRIGLAWFSPDCKHFSKAKGGKPLNKRIRGLAWVVIKWARLDEAYRPQLIILENVSEFQTWGPLDSAGKPIKAKAGQTYLRWVAQLRNRGYEVETRELVAADYGVPTTRRRFFLIARCDGLPIRWPERTHAPRGKCKALGLKPWRSAAECIDFDLPCPSIFERKRPLAEATMRRIHRGLLKYVIDAAEPFIVCCNHGGDWGRAWSASEPLRTVTGSRDAVGVVVPHVSKFRTGATGSGADEPVPTITAGGGNPKRPAGAGHALGLVETFLTKYHGPKPGDSAGRAASPADPIKTLDTQNRFGVVAATLIQTGYGEREGQAPRVPGVEKPLGTIVGGGQKHAVVAATLMTNTTGHSCNDLSGPVPTLTSGGQQAVAAAFLQRFRFGEKEQTDPRQPIQTITAGGNHFAEVRAFLVKYYGNGGQDQDARSPMHTLTAKARLGLVTVAGEDYQICDIGLRMLKPKELLRAQFGRFADEYILTGTQADQVAAIGNSVPPELAEAIVRANWPAKSEAGRNLSGTG